MELNPIIHKFLSLFLSLALRPCEIPQYSQLLPTVQFNLNFMVVTLLAALSVGANAYDCKLGKSIGKDGKEQLLIVD